MASLVLIFCLFVLCSASQNEGPVLTSPNDTVIIATNGSDVTLICETAVMTYGVVWYFNNEPVMMGVVENQRGTLTLSPLELADSGWYTCVADNYSGRDEKDFLLLVGAPSMEVFTFNETMYTVPVGSRVELPCHFTGVPQPTIRWFQVIELGNSIEITGNDESYNIDNVTKSLVMFGPSQEQTLTFYCTAQNMFDEAAQRRNVTVEFFNYAQTSETISFPLNSEDTQSMVVLEGEVTLQCTNMSDLTNYSVTWTRNLDPATASQENERLVNESGYYCCQVTGQELRESFFCITVLDRRDSFPQLSTPASSVSLPADSRRAVNLLCMGYTQNLYAPPTVELYSLNSIVTSSTLSDGVNYMYLVEDVNGTDCAPTPCLTTYVYTCSGTNFAGNDSTYVTVNSVAVCSGDNALMGGNPNITNTDSWSNTSTGARIASVLGERVFVLDYNDSDAIMPSFSQTMDIPDNSILFSIDMSGRVRQEGSGNFRATVQLLSDDKDISFVCPYLTNPNPTLPSWQWIGCRAFPKSTSNLTVILTVVRGDESQSGSGTAYFDDLCVTMVIQGTGGLSERDKYIIIGVSGACGVLIVLILIVLCCICCCCGKRKGDVKMMKKMSTLIKKKRPSTVTHELGRTDGHYKPEAQQAPTQTNTYMVADSQVSDSYINPDNYTRGRGQPPVKVPPVKVERPNQSSTPSVAVPSPMNDSSNKENGLYTSLKREELDQNNLYMTPSNCSTSSLNKLIEGDTEGRQYVNIDGGTSTKYLTLVTQSSHRNEEFMKSSPSVGSRSPSPSYPPPPPPTRHRAKENGRRADSSPTAPIRSTSTDRTHSTSPLVPSSLTPEVSEQQIYENSQEVILSASPLFNGAPKTTSSGHLLPGISVSPPPASTLTPPANNQKIYENSQEFFVMEDSDEDDGYENDLPGLHR